MPRFILCSRVRPYIVPRADYVWDIVAVHTGHGADYARDSDSIYSIVPGVDYVWNSDGQCGSIVSGADYVWDSVGQFSSI